MNSTKYVFASCKQWLRPHFEALEREINGHWLWVSNPAELASTVETIKPRYIFFLHWNWLVPHLIWQRNECVCFHMTDVPFGRGGSPLQNLIVAGFNSTKLVALRMIEELDAGPVYTRRELQLSGTAQEIYIRAGELSCEIIRWMVSIQPQPTPQVGQVIPFRRRTPQQSRLPENGSLVQLYDHIRMLDAEGYPHAFINYGEFRIEIRYACLMNNGKELTAQVRISRNNAETTE